MITKLYAQIKKNLKENGKALFIMLLVFFILVFPLPYYIDTPGGAMDISKKIEVENKYKSRGSLNFAYVTELKATTFTYLLSLFNKDWKVLKKSEVIYDNETIKDMEFRDHYLLEESYDNATLVAYQKLNKDVSIKKERVYVTYLDAISNTDLKIADEILEINGKKITSKTGVLKETHTFVPGTILTIKVRNKGKEYTRKATIVEKDGVFLIGAMITSDKDLSTSPSITIKSKESESGPSGGLMLSLAIYNSLTKEDITNGMKIVGTGTIEGDGSVGSIGGVAFKLKGAVKEKADLFLVPKGENYNEVMKLKKKNHYKIKVKGISSFEEALTYLKKQNSKE